jgi:hypothetical protein
MPAGIPLVLEPQPESDQSAEASLAGPGPGPGPAFLHRPFVVLQVTPSAQSPSPLQPQLAPVVPVLQTWP